jgi:hypothetical protein
MAVLNEKREHDMSKQIEKLMAKHPNVFQSVSYEGNGIDRWGQNTGDGTWLYMEAGWYCAGSDCGSIHEYTIAEVLECWKYAYQDKQRWADEHPTNNEDEIAAMMRGDHDLIGGKK